MPTFKFKNLENKILIEQKVSDGFINLIEDFKKSTVGYNNGSSIPLYFDCSKNIKIKSLLEDCQKSMMSAEKLDVAFPINNKNGVRSFMVYLSSTNPIKESMAAHEVGHGLLYARGFKIVKHREKKFDDFEGKVISFAHHFPLRNILKKYKLYYEKDILEKGEDTISKNIKILQKGGYNGLNEALNLRVTFGLLNFNYISARATRRRLEKLIKLLPSEIYNKYKAIREAVGEISSDEIITPSGCKKIMVEILKIYTVEDKFIQDYNGFDDYLPYKKLLGQ